jgi:hypothetical protein
MRLKFSQTEGNARSHLNFLSFSHSLSLFLSCLHSLCAFHSLISSSPCLSLSLLVSLSPCLSLSPDMTDARREQKEINRTRACPFFSSLLYTVQRSPGDVVESTKQKVHHGSCTTGANVHGRKEKRTKNRSEKAVLSAIRARAPSYTSERPGQLLRPAGPTALCGAKKVLQTLFFFLSSASLSVLSFLILSLVTASLSLLSLFFQAGCVAQWLTLLACS